MMLHVACLPFPTHQGTQAAVSAMMNAISATGREAHLLTYSHRAYPAEGTYEIHRVPDFPKVRSLRSGPSIGKLALDAQCVWQIRRLARRLMPDAIVAHHVEAALAAIAAGVAPVFYVAHTSLTRELPTYFPRLPAALPAMAGRQLERWICRHAEGVGAVAPALAALLPGQAAYLPVPWRVEPPSMNREDARAALGLPHGVPIALYAGNLDRYQGWEHLIDATLRLRREIPGARLLIATESDPRPARDLAARRGLLDSVDLRGLDGGRLRALVHAASDVAWVPRKTEGGLPIKMLDAFGRRLPVVAMERATAGLSLDEACSVVPNDDPQALAAAASYLVRNPTAADALRRAGVEHLTTQHSDLAFIGALDGLTRSPTFIPPWAKRHAQRPRVAPARPAR